MTLATLSSTARKIERNGNALKTSDQTNSTRMHCRDGSLHLFVDDYHIRSLFAMKRVCGKLKKHPDPIVEDLPGRLISWAFVLREPQGKFRA